LRCALSVFGVVMMPKRASTAATFAVDLPSLRREVTELVAKNAVPMVRQAIDSVTEEGQYQAIKYLFEMIGLYPAATPDESPLQGVAGPDAARAAWVARNRDAGSSRARRENNHRSRSLRINGPAPRNVHAASAATSDESSDVQTHGAV
jgi:hypothetical protein